MLEIIKKTISELEDKTFHEFFTEYVFTVQDINIQNEIHSLQSLNSIDMMSMSKLVEETYRRLLQ